MKQVPPGDVGRLAQLVERQLDMLEVGGSRPSPPTSRLETLSHSWGSSRRRRGWGLPGLGLTDLQQVSVRVAKEAADLPVRLVRRREKYRPAPLESLIG